ncbi:MAG: hypothetical protein COZ11_12330 [Deltaproteobacteria bacterium CG_4_10_14_3_um_filter_51_14]|nr:MAG: hypothetical protein COZ11_12330 [Deltaproteobacteria bacterium CG_4_10_14_3_um_filter_51_14]PJB35799.1 MAG: hypothetical protein CO107_09750 [Deltaproteobacteria bacterium CG_4_9_14_3_um_filter_51_14]
MMPIRKHKKQVRPGTLVGSDLPKFHAARAWAIFAVAASGFLLSMFFRVSTAVISPSLARDLTLTSDQLGELSAAFFYAFALFQIPAGIALDRIGPRRTMGLLGLTGSAGAAAFAMAEGFSGAFTGRILLGVGMSCNLMGALTLFSVWFPINRFAFLSGIVVAIGMLGSMLGATPLAAISLAIGWRAAFFVFAAVNTLQAVLLFLVARDRPAGMPAAARMKNPFRGISKVFLSYNYWAMSAVGFFRYGFFAAIQSLWAGPFLMQGLGMDAISAGNVLITLSLGFIAGLPVSGILSDRILKSRKNVILPSLLALFLIIISFLAWDKNTAIWLIHATFFLLGFAAAPGQIIFAHIKELVPEEMSSTSMTGVNLFTMLGAGFLTQVLGTLVEGDPSSITDPSGFRFIWYAGAASLLAASALYVKVPDSKALKRKSS